MKKSAELVVVGAGAIGLSIAALFRVSKDTQSQRMVRVVGRANATAVRHEEFLFQQEHRQPHSISLPVYSNLQDHVDNESWIVLATKAYDLPEIIPTLNSVKSARKIAVLCNGIGIYDLVQKECPSAIVLRCLVHFGAKQVVREDAKSIEVVGEPRLVVSHSESSLTEATEFADLFRTAGFNVTSSSDIRQSEWSKALLNTIVNSIATLSGSENGGILDEPVLKTHTFPAFHESLVVAKAEGIYLPSFDWDAFVSMVRSFGGNVNSTLADYRSGRRTELNSFLGEVLRSAQRHEIEVPVLTRIAAELRQMGVKI